MTKRRVVYMRTYLFPSRNGVSAQEMDQLEVSAGRKTPFAGGKSKILYLHYLWKIIVLTHRQICYMWICAQTKTNNTTACHPLVFTLQHHSSAAYILLMGAHHGLGVVRARATAEARIHKQHRHNHPANYQHSQ